MCKACAHTCHKGHKLGNKHRQIGLNYSNFGSFFCDCGAGDFEKCQCVGQAITHPPKRMKTEDTSSNGEELEVRFFHKTDWNGYESFLKSHNMSYETLGTEYNKIFMNGQGFYQVQGGDYRCIAISGGKLAAFCTMYLNQEFRLTGEYGASFWNFFVPKESQGKGYGKIMIMKLTDFIKKIPRVRESSHALLWGTVASQSSVYWNSHKIGSHRELREWYHRRGFKTQTESQHMQSKGYFSMGFNVDEKVYLTLRIPF